MSDEIKEMTVVDLGKKQMATWDSFANFVSKVGVNAGQTNQISQSAYLFNLLTRNRVSLEAMYRGSWTVGVLIDTIADDMTRSGIQITSNDEAEKITELQTGLSRLKIWDSMNTLTKWGDLYGGAIGLLLIDGQDTATPLNPDRVLPGQFKGIKVFDRWQVTPDLTSFIADGPDAGLPEYYNLIISSTNMAGSSNMLGGTNSQQYMDGLVIHHSRVIRAIGIELPFFQAITEMMWGESVIERMYDRIVAFDNATMSMANLINHANLTNISIEGLREIIGAGGKALEGLVAQFSMMQSMRSNEGVTLVDKNDEVATNAYSFAGLSDVMLQLAQQLSGARGIPLTKFFGQSPAGLNSTGESDMRNYYDKINSMQEAKYRPGIEKVLKVAHKSIFGVPAPKDMMFKFTALWQMTAKEKSEIGKANAETITGVFAGGLISRSTALKELKQQSSETGLFTTISDEDIKEAEESDSFDTPPDAPEPNTEDNPDAAAKDAKALDAVVKLWKRLTK